jgi:transaldolase
VSNLATIAALGQSIWIDDLSRDLIGSGELARRIAEESVTGVTSNPTIFAAAVTGSTTYDPQIRELARRGASTPEIYSAVVTQDIQDACDVLRPVWERTDGCDGFVSVEVSPDLAHDTEGTVSEVREWTKRVDRPNLLVKVPATAEGVPAIAGLIGEGISINVTLIFALRRYRQVMEAYLQGVEELKDLGGDVSTVKSVASFFVSRFDTETDRRLTEIGTPEALTLRGKTAVANARVAYGEFLEVFAGERWESLARAGATVQRPLWASTSTKNAAYPDTLYVDALVAPDTVNTMPRPTLAAYQDHGNSNPHPFGAEDIARAREDLARLASVGVDYDDVTATLEREGVQKFADSYHELLEAIDVQRRRYAEPAE